jgi:hypothetical protein
VVGTFSTILFQGGQWERPDETISLGEGVFVMNPSIQLKTITFVGEILQGDLTNSITPGLSIHCSLVPKFGKLTQSLGLRLSAFDNVYLNTNNTLKVFTYLPNGSWKPFEPDLRVAESFVVNAVAPTNWVIHFEVEHP